MELDFKKNLSNIDRGIRIFLGFFVLSLGYGKPLPLHLWGIVLALAGILMLEGILGY